VNSIVLKDLEVTQLIGEYFVAHFPEAARFSGDHKLWRTEAMLIIDHL